MNAHTLCGGPANVALLYGDLRWTPIVGQPEPFPKVYPGLGKAAALLAMRRG